MNDIENLSTDVAATEPMDDMELQAIITQDLTDAISYVDSDLSPHAPEGLNTIEGIYLAMRSKGTARWWPWKCGTLSRPCCQA